MGFDDGNFNADGGFPYDYCQRAGPQPLAVNMAMADIARGYEALRVADCNTAGLLPILDTNQTIRWLDYLMQYSRAMAGCPLYQPVADGIRAFGPANTRASLGIEHPPLGPMDVALLSDHYLASFVSVLGLTEGERAAVGAHLAQTAELEIQSASNGAISLCPDAGN
jgi:hypothetical protein